MKTNKKQTNILTRFKVKLAVPDGEMISYFENQYLHKHVALERTLTFNELNSLTCQIDCYILIFDYWRILKNQQADRLLSPCRLGLA